MLSSRPTTSCVLTYKNKRPESEMQFISCRKRSSQRSVAALIFWPLIPSVCHGEELGVTACRVRVSYRKRTPSSQTLTLYSGYWQTYPNLPTFFSRETEIIFIAPDYSKYLQGGVSLSKSFYRKSLSLSCYPWMYINFPQKNSLSPPFQGYMSLQMCLKI